MNPVVIFSSLSLSLSLSLSYTHTCTRFEPDREERWAGLCLADDVLSAHELHDEFAKKAAKSKASLTRLMVLCACSSGTQGGVGLLYDQRIRYRLRDPFWSLFCLVWEFWFWSSPCSNSLNLFLVCHSNDDDDDDDDDFQV